MTALIRSLVLIGLFSAAASGLKAETRMFDITVTYRERIVLPPDAELNVQLFATPREGGTTRRIASQRFVMDTVPMTVNLSYDPGLIDDATPAVMTATIWSGGAPLFQTNPPQDVLTGAESSGINIVLSMIADPAVTKAVPRKITGVEWAVTEVFGAAWSGDDPATLVIDDEMNVSVFGGCNRFRGQATFANGSLAFTANFAGTMMACPDPVEAQERRFLDGLTRVSGYVRYGAGLVMTDAQGNAVLHFVERAD